MDNRSKQFRPWKICFELVLWILEEDGRKILSLIEFSYNNNFQASIQMAPFKALYGRRCRSQIRWFEVGEAKALGPDLVQYALYKVKVIRERLLEAQSRQKAYIDHRRRGLKFSVGE